MLYQSDSNAWDKLLELKILVSQRVLQFKWGHFNLQSWPGKDYFMLSSFMCHGTVNSSNGWSCVLGLKSTKLYNIYKYNLIIDLYFYIRILSLHMGKNIHIKWLEYCPTLRQGFDTCRDDVTNNILSDVGFCKALELCLRLLPCGLLFGALPCQSYGFMSSATHGRSGANPHGCPQYPFVIERTTFVARFAIMALVVLVRGSVWGAENPARTTLQHMPEIQTLMNPILRPLMVNWYHS